MPVRENDWLYPPIEPYRAGFLDVPGSHRLYFEECGNPDAKPAIVLHGGPGYGIEPSMRRFFDPTRYRIVLLDQRGCGRSTPFAGLDANTSADLVSDIERLRSALGIEHWLVFGGSWGSTLGLLYAQAHPQRVSELVLRGIFLHRQSELDWFYQRRDGAAALFPDQWEKFEALVPPEERGDMIAAYHRRLHSDDVEVRHQAALAWSRWEIATSSLHEDRAALEKFENLERAVALAMIETHYFLNAGFLESDGHILRHIDRIRSIPAVVVQGRYDIVCPMRSAWDLHRAWPEADLRIVPDGGHASADPAIGRALVEATAEFALG